MELLQNIAAIKLQHIPYKGGAPAMQAVIAGETQMMVATMPGSLPHLKSGRLRALGVTSAKRSALLPEIPTVAESGVPGYEYVTWYGVFAPSGSPGDVITQLNAAISRLLARYRDAGSNEEAGHRTRWQHAGSVRYFVTQGDYEMDEGHQAGRHQTGRVISPLPRRSKDRT